MAKNELPYFALNPDLLDGAIQCCRNEEEMSILLTNLMRAASGWNEVDLIPFKTKGTKLFFEKMCKYADEKAEAYSKRISGLRQYRKNDHPKD